MALHKPISIMNRRDKGAIVAMRDGCDKVNHFNPIDRGMGEISF